jgi:hypothetical protein
MTSKLLPGSLLELHKPRTLAWPTAEKELVTEMDH